MIIIIKKIINIAYRIAALFCPKYSPVFSLSNLYIYLTAAFFIYLFTPVLLLHAQTYENILQYKEPVSNFNFDFTATIIKFILATVICIIIILVMKKYMGAIPGRPGNENIKILDYQAISNDKYIYIVEIYNKIFILGVSQGGINKITEITDHETIDFIRLKSDKNIKSKMFSEYLKKFMPADKTSAE